MFTVEARGSDILISGLDYFSVELTFDCGQSFRFKVDERDGVRRADGIAHGRRVSFIQRGAGELVISPCTVDEYEEIWRHYLALDEDYAAIRREMRALRPNDGKLFEAMKLGRGIRVLHQEPWEALCTFIISQNNNIPRITGLVAALCRAVGEKIGEDENGEPLFAFPTPEAVKLLGVDGLYALKMGFRASYLYDAACKMCDGTVSAELIRACSTEEAERALRVIRGVGPKVAACALLFGFEKADAFPIDVWVKRVMAEYYPDGISPSEFGANAGLAQQYLFHHRRVGG